VIYENKSELALDDGFASKIEPAATDKDAFIIAHQGAAEYINDDTKSFMDRYSDMMYFGAAALSVIGSIFAAIYTNLTKAAPEQASELATAILDTGERIEHANSLDAIGILQDELEAIPARRRDRVARRQHLDRLARYVQARLRIRRRRDRHAPRLSEAPRRRSHGARRQRGSREDGKKRLRERH
jgi:hypothetical protein